MLGIQFILNIMQYLLKCILYTNVNRITDKKEPTTNVCIQSGQQINFSVKPSTPQLTLIIIILPKYKQIVYGHLPSKRNYSHAMCHCGNNECNSNQFLYSYIFSFCWASAWWFHCPQVPIKNYCYYCDDYCYCLVFTFAITIAVILHVLVNVHNV